MLYAEVNGKFRVPMTRPTRDPVKLRVPMTRPSRDPVKLRVPMTHPSRDPVKLRVPMTRPSREPVKLRVPMTRPSRDRVTFHVQITRPSRDPIKTGLTPNTLYRQLLESPTAVSYRIQLEGCYHFKENTHMILFNGNTDIHQPRHPKNYLIGKAFIRRQ